MRQNQVDPEFERIESLVELSHSISTASLFPPFNSDTDASSESDESASRFSHLSLTIPSLFSRILFSPLPTTNLSIPSLFLPTISDTELEESKQTPPRLSYSIDSLLIPTSQVSAIQIRYRLSHKHKRCQPFLSSRYYSKGYTNDLHYLTILYCNGECTPEWRSIYGECNGKRAAWHGLGKYLWIDGCMYEGEWRRGKAYGKDKLGQKEGFGIFIGADGDTYRGSWSSDWKHGYGHKCYVNGGLYVGLWKRNMQDGHGRYIWNNGNEYIGEWKKGVILGHGVLIWANKNNYNGEWENWVPKGDEVFTWADGSCYVGRRNKDLNQMKGAFYPLNGNSNGENLIITMMESLSDGEEFSEDLNLGI